MRATTAQDALGPDTPEDVRLCMVGITLCFRVCYADSVIPGLGPLDDIHWNAPFWRQCYALSQLQGLAAVLR